MDPYRQGGYSYRDDFPPSDRRVPRSFDPVLYQRSYDPPPPHVEYPRTAQRVYAVAPGAVSYPPLPSNVPVEIRYYDPTAGPPVPVPLQPAPAPPPMQIQMPSGGSQFASGQLYRVIGVEDAPIYHSAPVQPRDEYGYPSVPRGPPTRRPPYYVHY